MSKDNSPLKHHPGVNWVHDGKDEATYHETYDKMSNKEKNAETKRLFGGDLHQQEEEKKAKLKEEQDAKDWKEIHVPKLKGQHKESYDELIKLRNEAYALYDELPKELTGKGGKFSYPDFQVKKGYLEKGYQLSLDLLDGKKKREDYGDGFAKKDYDAAKKAIEEFRKKTQDYKDGIEGGTLSSRGVRIDPKTGKEEVVLKDWEDRNKDGVKDKVGDKYTDKETGEELVLESLDDGGKWGKVEKEEPEGKEDDFVPVKGTPKGVFLEGKELTYQFDFPEIEVIDYKNKITDPEEEAGMFDRQLTDYDRANINSYIDFLSQSGGGYPTIDKNGNIVPSNKSYSTKDLNAIRNKMINGEYNQRDLDDFQAEASSYSDWITKTAEQVKSGELSHEDVQSAIYDFERTSENFPNSNNDFSFTELRDNRRDNWESNLKQERESGQKSPEWYEQEQREKHQKEEFERWKKENKELEDARKEQFFKDHPDGTSQGTGARYRVPFTLNNGTKVQWDNKKKKWVPYKDGNGNTVNLGGHRMYNDDGKRIDKFGNEFESGYLGRDITKHSFVPIDHSNLSTYGNHSSKDIAASLSKSKLHPGIQPSFNAEGEEGVQLPNGKFVGNGGLENNMDAWKEIDKFYKNTNVDADYLTALNFGGKDIQPGTTEWQNRFNEFNRTWGKHGYTWEETPGTESGSLLKDGKEVLKLDKFRDIRGNVSKIKKYLYDNYDSDFNKNVVLKIKEDALKEESKIADKRKEFAKKADTEGVRKEAENTYLRKNFKNDIINTLSALGLSEEAQDNIKKYYDQNLLVDDSGIPNKKLGDGNDITSLKGVLNAVSTTNNNDRDIIRNNYEILNDVKKNGIFAIKQSLIDQKADTYFSKHYRESAKNKKFQQVTEFKQNDINAAYTRNNNRVQASQEEYEKKKGEIISVIQSKIANARQDGIDIVYSGGNFIVEGKDIPDLDDRVAYYSTQMSEINNVITNLDQDFSSELDNIMLNYGVLDSEARTNDLIVDVVNRETGTSAIAGTKVLNSINSIGHSVAGYFDSDYATMLKSAQEFEFANYYEKPVSLDMAWENDDMWRKSLFAVSDQTGNIGLAITTAGFGTYFQAGRIVTGLATGTAFGTHAGSQQYLTLTQDQDRTAQAKLSLIDLKKNKDKMSILDYTKAKGNLEQTIALGDISESDKVKASLSVGFTEATISSVIGTGPNILGSIRRIKGLGGTGVNVAGKISRSNFNAWKHNTYSTGRQMSGELVEENLIEGTNVYTNNYFLNRDDKYTLADAKETSFSAVVTSGSTQIAPGVYSTIVEQAQTKEYREQVLASKNKINELKSKLGNLNDITVDGKTTENPMRAVYADQLKAEVENLVGQHTNLEVDALVLSQNGDMNKLLDLAINENYLNSVAGVKPTDSKVQIEERRQAYKESITEEQAKDYDNQINEIQQQREKIVENIDYSGAIENTFGLKGELLDKKLKNNPDYKKADTRGKLGIMLNSIRDEAIKNNVKKGKNDPAIKAFVEKQVYDGKSFEESGRKNRKAKQEEALYNDLANDLLVNQRNALIVATEGNTSANKLLSKKQLEGLQITEAKSVDEIIETVDKAEGLTVEEKQGIILGLTSGEAKAVIIDNKYIVTDKEAADIALDNGDLLQGTAMSHEISHFIDDASFENETEKATYTENLNNFVSKTSPEVHDRATTRVNYITDAEGNQLYQEGKPFEEQDIVYKDEYTKAVQDILMDPSWSKEYSDIKKKAGIGFINKARMALDKDFAADVNTEKSAGAWMVGFIDNFKEGKLSPLAERKIAAKKAKTKKSGISFSQEASNNVQRIYNERGVSGAMDIINAFKPITNKLVQKRSEAPNFDRQLLTDEIETGKRGIFDLIQEYKPESGVPLAAYINTYLPSRAIEASQRVLGEEFTEDVTERVDIATEEDITQEPTQFQRKKIILSDRLGIKDKVDKAIKAKLPDLNVEKLNFKTLKDQTPEITGEIFGISPKKLASGANITKGELQSAQMFINKNADVLLSMLPEGATTGGTATGVPNTLLKAFYTKTNRAKMAKTGTKAGLAIQVKNPNITKSDFLEVFGIVDGKPNRTDRNTSARVLALANQTGKMMTNQAVREKLMNDESSNNHVLGLLEDGKARVMFSKGKPLSNKQKQEIGNRARELGEQLKAEQGSYSNILNDYDMDAINMKSKEGRKAYKQWLYTELASKLPKSFFLHFGTFTGTTKKAKDGGRTYGGNYAFLNNPEVQKAVDNAVKSGTEFAKADKDIENAVKKTSYTAASKMSKKERNAFNESKRRGFKKIWNVFEDMIQEDANLNAPMIAALLSSTSAYQGHFMRTASPVAFFNSLQEKNVEEHTAPASDLGKFLLNRAIQGNIDQYIDGALEGYFQGSLPDKYDKKLKGLDSNGNKFDYSQNAPLEYMYDILMGTKPVWIRYFNPNVNNNNGGIDPNVLILTNGNSVAQEYGIGIEGNYDQNVVSKQQQLLFEIFNGDTTREQASKEMGDYFSSYKDAKVKTDNKAKRSFSDSVMFSRSTNNKSKGITVLDFDDTLATSKSKVISKSPDGKVRKLTAEEFAKEGADLLDQGWKHDFSEFSKVVDGKVASLFNKALKLQGKFGPDNMFVLTARPADSAPAIFEFLKANGLNIPLKNITGLANSTPEAKALWIANKVGEGYNDFYFADDALQNVQAVKNMLDQFDVKSKVQQARVKFSQDMSKGFNDIIESTTGVKSEKVFSDAQARLRGNRTKYKYIIPPSAQDFAGLLYNFLGKGKKGEADMAFFKKALIDPFARGVNELNASRQTSANDYKNLLKASPWVKKRLKRNIEGLDYNWDQAVRVYLWNKAGFEVPGLSKRDLNALDSMVKNNSRVQAFADALGEVSKKTEGYSQPSEFWLAENITSDLLSDGSIGDARAEFLSEWKENVDVIFNPENLNKIESIYGSKFREALQDVLYRMETGRSRPTGGGRLMNTYMNWVNNSVGAIMFFNMRSALLQTISATNYINWSDNNPLKAATAFANQPQYWRDFAYLFNSDFLKQRRAGNQRGINEAELSQAVAGSTNKAKAAIAWLLKKGFLPTQIADSFAISSGGATFYRNRVNKYVKEGLSKKDAEAQAFLDFQETTEVAQQSARPDMISQQQASPLGRLILSFQNTPMQYARIMNKAARDLVNRRGDSKTHISKIVYYGVVQSIIFGALQSALFAALGQEDEEEYDKKKERILNGMVDSWLSGIGYGGKAISTTKNSIMEYQKQKDKGYQADHAYTILQLLGFSPPIGSKLRKIYSSIQTEKFNEDVFGKRGFTLDNPVWSAVGNVVEGVTNIPLGRLSNKMLNLDNAMDSNNEWWQRAALVLGWNTWDLGIRDKDIEKVKEEIKEEKKIEKKIKTEEKKIEKKKEVEKEKKKVAKENEEKSKKDGICSAVSKSGKRCKKKVVAGKLYCTIHEKVEQNETGKKSQCKKIKNDGKRCKMQTSNKSGYCYYHD